MRRPRVPALVLAAAGAVACLAGATAASAASTSSAATVDRVVADRRIDESSGLAPSGRFPGVLWTIEDSGNPAVISAIDAEGRTAARLSLRGVAATDWEAVAAVDLPDGRPGLVVGDIGDNRAAHSHVDLVVVAEPKRLASATVSPLLTLRLTYPDHASDAEALLADPRTGRLAIVTKDLLGAGMYTVPDAVWPPADGVSLDAGLRSGTLEAHAALSTPIVTDGAVLPDGRVVVRTYSTLYVLPAMEDMTASRISPLATARLPAQEQGESLALLDGGRAVLVGTEGVRQPILRVPLPQPGPPTSDATSEAAPTPGGSAQQQPSGATADNARASGSWVRPAIVAGAVGLLTLISGIALAGRRRDGPPRQGSRRPR